jgi:hypothetical protein
MSYPALPIQFKCTGYGLTTRVLRDVTTNKAASQSDPSRFAQQRRKERPIDDICD